MQRQRARQNCTDELQRLMMKKLKLFIQKLTRRLEIRKKEFSYIRQFISFFLNATYR